MILDSSKNVSNMASSDHYKNISKKYQKHEIVHNIWRLLRPQRFILPYFEDTFRLSIVPIALFFFLVTRHRKA